ncbi:cell adhesion molecule DSCAM-like isoform X2 [Gadus chalcogrammus]|uniref:cell adhesion molecule DSCAM-like isoform X2 n=1 Tax=Gadus chalcogrammus TaxID=1042646 RepID=UPI0024C4C0A0|nr:cell adhesion molecule DSCAM-like isoform X2 [Gadus chalcogrammus]
MGELASSRCLTFGGLVLFCLLLGGVRGQGTVVARVGEDVTLPCSYDAVQYGALGVCWGRGPIPTSGCSDEVLRTDGSEVVSRLSERYRLPWFRGPGDVSLTLVQVQESDAGVYGCRVDIPGWFNDQIHETTLSVVAAPPHAVRLELGPVGEKTLGVRWSPGLDGGRPITGYRIDYKDMTAPWEQALTTEGVSPSLTQVTLIDMRPNKAYTIRMFAVNSEGLSEPSNVVTVSTKESVPDGPPLDVKVEALTPRSLRVTWKPPRMELRNGVLRGYVISYREYISATRLGKWLHQTVSSTADPGSKVLNYLRPATQYSVLIDAMTMAGRGPAFTAPLCSTLAEVLATTTQGPTTAATTFEKSTATSKQNPTTLEQITIPFGEISTTSSPVTPGPPTLELLGVHDEQVSLRWTAGFNWGIPVSSYDLEYKEDKATWDSTQRIGGISPNQSEATLIEMRPSTYHIRVFARSSAGSSPPSNVLTFIIAEKGPQTDTPTTVLPFTTTAAVLGEGVEGSPVAAVAVPVLLVVLFVAALLVAWGIRRSKSMKGSLAIAFPGNRSRLSNSEPLSEL